MKRILAEKEQSRLQLENDSLHNRNSILELEKQTAELDTEKQHLARENMMLRILQLETENEQLKVLSEKDELSDDVKEVIKERIGILNALFAANILDKEPAATAYVDLVKREISDKEKFMNSNRITCPSGLHKKEDPRSYPSHVGSSFGRGIYPLSSLIPKIFPAIVILNLSIIIQMSWIKLRSGTLSHISTLLQLILAVYGKNKHMIPNFVLCQNCISRLTSPSKT